MITKEIWDTLSKAERLTRLRESLEQLVVIDEGKHPLAGKPEQGSLTAVKKDLEDFVLKIVEWENPKYEENRPSA